jgi:phosphoenolpyruvate synthase/pyruvate phosphate dikinase
MRSPDDAKMDYSADTGGPTPDLSPIDRYVLRFEEIDRTRADVVGGKGAHLGELSRLDGVGVPPGFCVTTDAFRRIIAVAPSMDDQLDRLSRLNPNDRDAIRSLSTEVRRTLEAVAVPDDVASAITSAVARLGAHAAYAVRSSATAEDLPTASFAGQHDTYLNIAGSSPILEHVRSCWASLFTERAVTYRLRNGFDHRTIQMAVVVQQMITPDVSGVLFTADPATSNRKIATVESSFGLGEALVAGLVNPDTYHVRDGHVRDGHVATKQLAIHPSPSGGTQEHTIDPAQQNQPALTDEQVLRLVALGRRIEAHFGAPQDIEWCLVDDDFHIVQSRPITTLFPIPAVDDADNHVYVSVGHQQMMTDPMKPLGLSMWLLTTPAPMHTAGGRLFVDVTPRLASPTTRASVLVALGQSDPLIADALQTVLDRDDFIATIDDHDPRTLPPLAAPAPIETDPAIVIELIEQNQASVVTLQREIQSMSGPELFDFILADLQELKRLLFDPRSHQVFMSAIEATSWLNEHLHEWLGEKNVADTLTRSAPNNITSEMGLALLDVADAIRPHPEVVAFLERVDDDGFLDELADLDGGGEARDAIAGYLDTYGMRCVGEIDITRPRWTERPTALVPLIVANIKNFEPGAARRRFEQGLQEAAAKEHEVLEGLRSLPGGAQNADDTKQNIDRVRAFIGYREYPKYGMVSRYFIYKQAMLAEAERLVKADVLREPEDIFYLSFDELHDVARTHRLDRQIVDQRRDDFRSYGALTPPRVLTSDGEALTGAYRRDDLPAGALIGLPVSAGTIEGRARIIRDIAEADVEAGDILVTAHTDPSWSPLFVAISGLVTEVGGLMTHGAVVAREYGLPAVVGVEHATRLITDGQRIRVNGTDGYIEILPSP